MQGRDFLLLNKSDNTILIAGSNIWMGQRGDMLEHKKPFLASRFVYNYGVSASQFAFFDL